MILSIMLCSNLRIRINVNNGLQLTILNYRMFHLGSQKVNAFIVLVIRT